MREQAEGECARGCATTARTNPRTGTAANMLTLRMLNMCCRALLARSSHGNTAWPHVWCCLLYTSPSPRD
eukprot:8445408-Alexandrium_andersonii.AAC.1